MVRALWRHGGDGACHEGLFLASARNINAKADFPQISLHRDWILASPWYQQFRKDLSQAGAAHLHDKNIDFCYISCYYHF